MKGRDFVALAAVVCLLAPLSTKANFIGVSFAGDVYSINASTGMGSLIGPAGFTSLNSMSVNPSGVYYTVSGGTLVTIDPNTGLGTPGPLLTVTDLRGLAFQGSVLYGIVNGGGTTVPDNLYTIDTATGISTLIGNTGFPGIQGLAFSPGGTLYAYDIFDGLLTVNTATGAATDVNPAVPGTGDIQSLDFAPDGTLYAARGALFTINTMTGVQMEVGTGGYTDVRGIGFIPEPATLTALGLGIAVLASRRRRDPKRTGAARS